MGVYKGQQPNVFRAVSGSLFSSPINWSKGFVPTGSDVATIADDCIIDINRTIGGLVVRSPFTASINTGLTLQVNNIIDVRGQLNCSGSPNIISFARKNIINNLLPASSSFLYTGSVNQNVPGGPYFDLTIYGTGIKTVTSNTTVSRSLTVGLGAGDIRGFLELGLYDLSVFGNTVVAPNGNGVLSKSNFGNLLFVGSFANGNRTAAIRFSAGNPNVEFKSGIITTNSNPSSDTIQSGTGTWTFTSPTQTLQGWSSGFLLNLDANIIISSSATLNIFGGYSISNPINGAGPSSNLVMLNNSLLNFITAKALVNSMTTGSFDLISSSSTISISGDYSATIPARFNTFRDLSISMATITNTIALSSNTYVSNSLSISAGILELSSSNLTVSGSTILNAGLNPKLSKSGPGNVLFIGNLFVARNFATVDFSGGNPIVECRSGITLQNASVNAISSGTGSWTFTTNNQNLLRQDNTSTFATFNCPVFIANGITLSVSASAGNTNIISYFSGSINGLGPSSRFVMAPNGIIAFSSRQSAENSLTTGSFDFISSINTVWFGGDYTGTIPSRFSSFYGLGISGLGTKSLSTDTYVSGNLSVVGNSPTVGGYFDISGSNLFVSGTSTGTNGTLVKSGPGRITFGGYANFGNGNVFNLTGNPTVEFQNGCFIWKNNAGFQNLGTGSYIFSTRNQTVSFANGDFYQTVSKIHRLIVSGAIAVTASSPFNVEINDTITGTDPSSIFSLGPTSLYINTTSSLMPTGTLDLSNTGSAVGFVYSDINVSNYNIPYTNFSGSLFVAGLHTTKSLSGNTYVRGAMNGFIQGSSGVVGILECGNHDLFVSGAVNAPTRFFKSGPGYVTFNGNVTMANGVSLSLTGHPTLEFRNSLYLLLNNTGFWNTGTGSFIFTTNPVQTLFLSFNGTYTWQNPIIISGSVNLIYTGSSGIIHARVFNGTDANSRLTINNNQTVTYNASQQPMLTGSIDFSSSLNTFVYNSGSQDVKGGIYRNLTFLNGLKTLRGNVSVLGTFSTGSGATSASINLNGFTLTNP